MVYRWVRRIPKGRVMTYGQISQKTQGRLSPRAVGWAMHACPDEVPWHRVVNSRGGLSIDGMQRDLLRAEGVRFRPDGTLDLKVYQHRR